jgi:hypothetical protein
MWTALIFLALIGAVLGVRCLAGPKDSCIMDAPDDPHETSMNDCGHRFKE